MIEILNPIFSAGTLLEVEHGLVMLLLLYGLLTFRDDKISRWVPLVIIAGVLLSLVTPVHEITLFWPLVTTLVVPPFLWQAGVAVTKSGPLRSYWSLAIWIVSLTLISLGLWLFSGIPFSASLLLGILTVSLVWYYREWEIERSYLSTIGLITLVILLSEIDLALVSPNLWMGTLATGITFGIAIGFIGIKIYRRIPQSKLRRYFFFIWAYIAYLIGLAFDISAITTTLAAGLFVSIYGFSTGLWYSRKDIPVPSNFPIFLYFSAGIWITLGWQAHTSIDPTTFSGILVALAVVTFSILVIRKVSPISNKKPMIRLIRKETTVFLLLFGAVTFWPQEAFFSTISVEVSLGVAVFLILALRVSIEPFFELIGVQLSWPVKNNIIDEVLEKI